MDPAQHSQFVARNAKLIRKIAYAWCRDATDREDVVQEVLVQLWRSADRYDPRHAESTWVYRIALNVAISFHRRERRHRRGRIPDQQAVIDALAAPASEPDARVEALLRAVDRLGPLEKALVLLHLDGNDHTTIADVLGISVSNVGTRLGRIKDKLRTMTGSDPQQPRPEQLDGDR